MPVVAPSPNPGEPPSAWERVQFPLGRKLAPVWEEMAQLAGHTASSCQTQTGHWVPTQAQCFCWKVPWPPGPQHSQRPCGDSAGRGLDLAVLSFLWTRGPFPNKN